MYLGPIPLEVVERCQALNKVATAHKKANDISKAIEALYEVKELKGALYDDDKLAKYLQTAGRFDEAIQVIEEMLAASSSWAKSSFNHQPVSVEQAQRVRYCMGLCGSARMICQREKRSDVAQHFEQLHGKYSSIWERLQPLADADVQQKKSDLEKASKEGREAMAAFQQKYRRRS